MNIELSPQVAIESRILRIPAFFKNLSRFVKYSDYHEPPYGANHLSRSQLSPASAQGSSACKCPHVLVSDDDPFQEFYYQVLFSKLMDSPDFPFKKEDFRLSVFKSGEELLEKYSDIQDRCSCGSCLLVITDYHMGRGKLNGVDTALALRKIGYTGPIILRTSENEEDLCKMNPNFRKLLKMKTIDSLQEKNKNAKMKEIVHGFLSNGFR